MKRSVLTVFTALAISFAANAQTEKGKVLLGGSLGYSYDHANGTDVNNQQFNITPNIGYFIANDIAIGTRVGYSYAESENSSFTSKTGAFIAAPFARKYAGSQTFKFFGELSVPMSWGSSKVNDTKIASTSSYGVQLSPGVVFFPRSNFGIELGVRGLYYSNNRLEEEQTGDKAITNSFGLSSNFFAPQLGVQFYF